METERLPEQDRLKSELVAMVSHEMRRPLTAILGFSQTLRSRWPDMPPELREEVIARIEENAQNLEHMIAQLLDFSRLQLGEFHVDLRSLDVGALVAQVLQNMAFELVAHDVRVQGAEVRALTEPYAFERILGNLLGNAAKFAPAGTPIEVRFEAAGDLARISVADRGPGVAPRDREHIFDRFYRGPGAVAGAGLGLAVVRELVELHGGSVRVEEDADGMGSVFTVDLPAGR